jgi:hypothetical protein
MPPKNQAAGVVGTPDRLRLVAGDKTVTGLPQNVQPGNQAVPGWRALFEGPAGPVVRFDYIAFTDPPRVKIAGHPEFHLCYDLLHDFRVFKVVVQYALGLFILDQVKEERWHEIVDEAIDAGVDLSRFPGVTE